MIALSISSFYNTSYGVFFVVYPIMLLSLVPVFNRHVAKQFIFSASLNCVEMVIIIGYLSQWPVIMTLVVFALCGSWGIATGVSGLIFTVLALVNYYTRDLHGSA